LYYETIFIVNPDISQENTEALTDDLIAKVEKVGGRIVKRENWGSRPLAYSIANRKRGNYILLVTDGSAEALKTLEHAISLEERIIRCLTTKLTELSDKASPLLRRAQAAAKRDEAPAVEEKASEEKASDDKPSDAAATEEKAAEATTEKTDAAATDGAQAST
jgi:small subunit ribosomal protein S6